MIQTYIQNLDDYDVFVSPIVCTDGSFVGQSDNLGMTVFQGIRYATANRFSPPVDFRYSGQIFEAKQFGASPMQTPGMLEQLLGLNGDDFDEDCFFLNIYRPSKKDDGPIPVLFWIYGGGFVNGSAAISWYDGRNLALQANAIVVTVNYRLGAFGYLGTTNLGLLDQICALKWVNRNIDSFGGDPSNVTIFGESAGGASVVALMATPEAQPYFAKAWAMSPSMGQFSTIQRSNRQINDLIKVAGVETEQDLLLLDPSALLLAQHTVLQQSSEPFSTFAPTQDGVVVPLNLLAEAACNAKPFVIGTNKDESRLWLMFDPNENQLDEHGARIALEKRTSSAADVWDVYKSARPAYSPSQIVAAYDSDANFRKYAWNLLNKREKNNCSSWSYWFTWATPTFDGMLGSCHALDVPFFFANDEISGAEPIIGSGAPQKMLAAATSAALARFADNSEPGWPQYNSHDRPTYVFDNICQLQQEPDAELYDYWNREVSSETN